VSIKFCLRLFIVLIGVACTQSGICSYALPINTDLAILPAEGELIYRSQVRYEHASEESPDPDGDLDRLLFPQTFVYGFSPKLSGSVKIPLRFDDLNGRAPDTDEFGVADIKVVGRYQIWINQEYLEASALTVLGGVELPSGDSTFSSRSFDPLLGFVFSRNQDRVGVYVDLTYQLNTENSDDFERGDELKWDIAFEYRLFPGEWSQGSDFSYSLLLELNGSTKQKNESQASKVDSSGGTTVFLSPGFQFQWKQMVLETSLQFPVIQNLGGDQLETDIVAVAGLRLFY